MFYFFIKNCWFFDEDLLMSYDVFKIISTKFYDSEINYIPFHYLFIRFFVAHPNFKLN